MKTYKLIRASKAFSLIELMVVVAIIAILAAIAIPAYQTYVFKSKISGVYGMLGSAKAQMAETYTSSNQFPASVTISGLKLLSGVATATTSNDFDTSIISSVTYTQSDNGSGGTAGKGLLSAQLTPAYGSGKLALVAIPPTVAGGTIKFACGCYAGITDCPNSSSYLPGSCSPTAVLSGL